MSNAGLSISNLLINAAAALIAGYGLLTNSEAVVIGSDADRYALRSDLGGSVSLTLGAPLAAVRCAGALFDALERRFARQARGSTLLAGISGFYMLHAYDHWSRVLGPRFWWFGAMIALCALLVVMLFIAEPLVLHSRFSAAAKRNPDRAFRIALRGHRLLSLVALITVLGAVGGAHGLFF